MQKKDWFKYRGYPHLSGDISISNRNIMSNYISNSQNIKGHKFLPLIRKEIVQRRYKKTNGKIRSHKLIKGGKVCSSKKVRTIMYSSHIDSHVYAYYSKKIIEPKYESKLKELSILNNSIIAYRSIPTIENKGNKNNIHFAKEVFEEIKHRKNCVALLLDIKDFFPSLNHKIIKNSWSEVIGKKSLPKDHYNLFKSITNFSFINLNDLKINNSGFNEKRLAEIKNSGKKSFFYSVKEFVESGVKVYKNPKESKGIPQGLPISALLANIYMLAFDKEICKVLCDTENVFYRRYSDDMIFLCEVNKLDLVRGFVENKIKDVKLEIAEDKTEVIYFENTIENKLKSYQIIDGNKKENMPLTYLGFEFYGYMTLIKSKNLASFYREMKVAIKRKHNRVQKLKQENLIDELPIFKRKIYRLYSYKGAKTRFLFKNGHQRKFRGNFIRYAYKSAEILEAPEIKKQVRNHWNILKKTLRKYEFLNVDKP